MADLEHWKQRARDAEAKLKELGHTAVDATKRGVDMGKAKVGIDAEAPIKDQVREGVGKAVDATKRGVDMGKAKVREEVGDMADFFKGVGPGVRRGVDKALTKGGANLDEPLVPQITEPAGRAVDTVRRNLDEDLTGDGFNLNEPLRPQAREMDMQSLFLDNVMGPGKPPPHMYQGAPPAPAGASMYEAPQLQRPQPGQGMEPPAMPPGQNPSMYDAPPPSMMQAGRQAMQQGGRAGGQAMEHALRAAEEAFNSVMQRYGGGGAPPAAPPAEAPPQAQQPYMYPGR